MKLVAEVQEWIAGAMAEFDDPATPVCQVFARCVTVQPSQHDELLACWRPNKVLAVGFGDGLWLPVPIDPDGMRIVDGALEAYGLKKICDGVWTITPSLNVEGMIHAFVIVYDVPTPAPWESVIVVVGGMGRL